MAEQMMGNVRSGCDGAGQPSAVASDRSSVDIGLESCFIAVERGLATVCAMECKLTPVLSPKPNVPEEKKNPVMGNHPYRSRGSIVMALEELRKKIESIGDKVVEMTGELQV